MICCSKANGCARNLKGPVRHNPRGLSWQSRKLVVEPKTMLLLCRLSNARPNFAGGSGSRAIVFAFVSIRQPLLTNRRIIVMKRIIRRAWHEVIWSCVVAYAISLSFRVARQITDRNARYRCEGQTSSPWLHHPDLKCLTSNAVHWRMFGLRGGGERFGMWRR